MPERATGVRNVEEEMVKNLERDKQKLKKKFEETTPKAPFSAMQAIANFLNAKKD